MDVQAAQAKPIEYPLRQDQAVGGDDHRIGLGRIEGQLRRNRVIRVPAIEPEAARLDHCDAMAERKLLDRGRLQLQAPPGWPVGLRQDQRNDQAGGVQALRRDHGELRRASENDTHRQRA